MYSSSECHQQHLYFHTCGHILTLNTHSFSCTPRDPSTACPNICAEPTTTQTPTFSTEACHICTSNTAWLEKNSHYLISKTDLELAQKLIIKEENRGGKIGFSWAEPANYPSVLARDEGCVVRRVISGECGCVMEVVSHSTSCYAKGIKNCDRDEVLVVEEEMWQENGCAWCRGDHEYLKRFGDVIRRVPSDRPVAQREPAGDANLIENWIQEVDAIPFCSQEADINNLLADTARYYYSFYYAGGEFTYPEYSYYPSEAHEGYAWQIQECFFSHKGSHPNMESIPAPKTPITLFPDEEENLLELYSPAVSSSLTYGSSAPSLMEEDALNEEFEEIMSIHFSNLFKGQTSECKYDEGEDDAVSIDTASEFRHVDFWGGSSYSSMQKKTIGSPNTVATELFSGSEGGCGWLN